MRIKKFLKFVLLISFVASTSHAFETEADYAYLVDLETDTVLVDKKSTERMYPSSMTKIMTAYLAFEALKKGYIDFETEFLVSKKAWKKGGSKMFIKQGDKVRVIDLLRGIVVSSGNDASIALAEGMSGTEDAFVDEMNRKADELGMDNTQFRNSTGWPDEDHYTTAEDLIILSKAIMKNFPKLYKMFAEEKYKYAGIEQTNRNWLLGSNGVDGLKTGYTEAAGYGLLATAKREGRRLIALVNGLDSKKSRVDQAGVLLDYGYRAFENVPIFKKNQEIAKVKIAFSYMDEISAVVKEDVIYTVKTMRADGSNEFTAKAFYNEPLTAPIPKDAKIGKLEIYRNGELAKTVKLYAGKPAYPISFMRKLLNYPLYLITGKY